MLHSLRFCSGSCSRRHLTTYCLTSSDERLCRLTSNSLASLLVIRGSLSCSRQATMVAATAKSLTRLPAENPAKDAERLGHGMPVQGSRQRNLATCEVLARQAFLQGCHFGLADVTSIQEQRLGVPESHCRHSVRCIRTRNWLDGTLAATGSRHSGYPSCAGAPQHAKGSA